MNCTLQWRRQSQAFSPQWAARGDAPWRDGKICRISLRVDQPRRRGRPVRFECGSDARESARPEFHDCRVVEVFFGCAFDVVVSFPSRSGARQRDTELIGEIKREAEILVHEAQRKTGDVFAFEEIGRFDVEDAGAGHAGLQDFDELFALETGAGNESESFGESIHLQREDQIHGELDGLTGAVRAKMKNLFAHYREDGFGFLERLGVPPTMKSNSPFLAPQSPPVTGASRKRAPRSAQAAAILRARAGEMVLESM